MFVCVSRVVVVVGGFFFSIKVFDLYLVSVR